MKTLKTSLLAATIVLSSLLGAAIPQVASADQSAWSSTVLASSSMVRFEATPSSYDAVSNKYTYKFAWLMPARRTYSFKIDGKMYQSRVTKNGVLETPAWFSPDITYAIQIYPYANGAGKLLAEGSFKAPSVTPPAPTTTREEEYKILYNYITAAPKLPTATINSKMDTLAIMNMLSSTDETIGKFSDLAPYMTAKSLEMLSKTPLLKAAMDAPANDGSSSATDFGRVKIYRGAKFGSLKYKFKDSSGHIETMTMVFAKENDQWKIDMIQTFKVSFSQFLK